MRWDGGQELSARANLNPYPNPSPLILTLTLTLTLADLRGGAERAIDPGLVFGLACGIGLRVRVEGWGS